MKMTVLIEAVLSLVIQVIPVAPHTIETRKKVSARCNDIRGIVL